MSMSVDTQVSQIRDTRDLHLTVPGEMSFFAPCLGFYLKQTLEIGGEAYLARTKDVVSGMFIWDDYEKTGTIFTRSRMIFDHFYQLKDRFDYLFAELKTEQKCEPYDILTIDLSVTGSIDHRFRHEISIAEDNDREEVDRFMVSNHPGMNPKWVRVALQEGEKCFLVRLKKEIGGVGWLSIVDGIGNLHSLYVKREYRNLGIGEDILYARLLYLKARRARSAFSEIEQGNHSSSKVASKAHMQVTGHIYQYFQERRGQVLGAPQKGH